VTDDDTSHPAASLLLDGQLCFARYAALRAVTAAYRPLIDGLGLTCSDVARGNIGVSIVPG
jgi:hypothetical protein